MALNSRLTTLGLVVLATACTPKAPSSSSPGPTPTRATTATGDNGQDCRPRKVLIVLDRSSSMVLDTVGGQTKWNIAAATIGQMVTTFASSVQFGLMVFPTAQGCSPGEIKVPIGPNSANTIQVQLGTPPPAAGNFTPMYQSLYQALQTPALNTPDDSVNHVIVITDGWQWCSPYAPENRFKAVDAVTAMAGYEIKTWVVGFSDKVDALTLNRMAAAGGTKTHDSCDPDSDSPTSGQNCYYQANNATQLLTALQRIVTEVSAEICDGKDNNCNGEDDEGLVGATCSKQRGVCHGTRKTCGGTTGWTDCATGDYETHAAASNRQYQDQETLCDNVDNDCDGTVDEDCDCVNGQTRPCGETVGVCEQGAQTCIDGAWGACEGGVQPSAEVCDGKDNDCNGQSDENLTRTCQNACSAGVESCANGAWTGCTARQPAQEICDNLDNDCDGVADGPGAYCANGGACYDGQCHFAGGGSSGCSLAPGSNNPAPGNGPLPYVLLLLLIAPLARRRAR